MQQWKPFASCAWPLLKTAVLLRRISVAPTTQMCCTVIAKKVLPYVFQGLHVFHTVRSSNPSQAFNSLIRHSGDWNTLEAKVQSCVRMDLAGHARRGCKTKTLLWKFDLHELFSRIKSVTRARCEKGEEEGHPQICPALISLQISRAISDNICLARMTLGPPLCATPDGDRWTGAGQGRSRRGQWGNNVSGRLRLPRRAVMGYLRSPL